MITKLRKVNDVMIHEIRDEQFKAYGRIVTGYDFSELINFMEKETTIPEKGNTYIASILEMEQMAISSSIKNTLYGGMPIQIGYCNGKNTTYNGFEYHKGSEINIAVTDFMLVLGHTWEIKNNSYKIEEAKVFYVPQGTAIEMYQTTLHLSPCRVNESGFKDIVILPRGTNTPFLEGEKEQSKDQEAQLLLQKNKWVIAHPEREPLIKQGAHPGLIGRNKELYY